MRAARHLLIPPAMLRNLLAIFFRSYAVPTREPVRVPGVPPVPGKPEPRQEAVGSGELKPVEVTPYEMAKTYLGTKEIPGKKHNGLIVSWLQRLMPTADADEISWCSAFVNEMALATGYEQSKSLTARSWLKCGDPIKPGDAQPGDVVIFWRESPTSWKGHVAFFVGYEGSKIKVLGGNQSDAVTIANYPRSQLLGIRRLRRVAPATVN